MRTISTALDKVLTAATGYAVHTRVRVDKTGSGSYQDLSSLEGWDWVRGATLQEDVDAPMAKATVLLQREIEKMSLAKLVSGSKLNIGSTMVDIARSIKVDTATLPKGRRPAAADWVNHFDGYITHLDWGGRSPVLKLECLDLGWRLQRCFIENVRQYGSGAGTAVQTVMQSIIDDNLGGGVVTLYTPVSPGWNVGKFKQQKEPVLVALRKLAAQIGWDVKYRWDNGTGAFRLTFFSVERDSPVVDRTFTAAQYRDLQRASLAAEDIRNKVKITFTHATNGRTTWTEEDAASQAKFGIHYMEIVEAAASLIDSDAEAEAMALAILKDLKDQTLDHAVAQPFFGPAMLGDYYTYAANGIHYDTAQSLAVVGISHELAPKTVRTVITTRGKPSLGKRRWLEMEGRPGIGPATDDGNDEAPTASVEAGLGGLIVTCDDPRTLEPPVRDWAYTEVYVSTATIADPGAGVRPSEALLKAKGRQTRFEIAGLIPNQTYYTRILHIDESGNIGAVSSEVQKATARVGPYHQALDTEYGGIIPNGDFSIWSPPQDDETAYPPDNWAPYDAPAAEFVRDDTLWGSGNDQVYFVTTPVQSGRRAIRIRQTASSDFRSIGNIEMQPVSGGTLYAAYVALRVTNAANECFWSARLYAEDKTTTAGSVTRFGTLPPGANVWYNSLQPFKPGTSARYVRLVAGFWDYNSGTETMYVDYASIFRALPSFRAYRATSTQSIATGTPATLVQLNAEDNDNGSNFDSSTNHRFTVPADGAGLYEFMGSVEVNSLASMGIARAWLYKNGSVLTKGPTYSNGTGGSVDIIAIVQSGKVELDAGDYVDLRFSHNHGSNRDIDFGSDITFLAGARVQ